MRDVWMTARLYRPYGVAHGMTWWTLAPPFLRCDARGGVLWAPTQVSDLHLARLTRMYDTGCRVVVWLCILYGRSALTFDSDSDSECDQRDLSSVLCLTLDQTTKNFIHALGCACGRLEREAMRRACAMWLFPVGDLALIVLCGRSLV